MRRPLEIAIPPILRRLPGVRRAVDVLHVYVEIRGIEVYEHASNMRKIC